MAWVRSGPGAGPRRFTLGGTARCRENDGVFKLDGATRVGIRCHYCSVGCGIDAWVRDGRLVYLDGDPEHPVNGGRLCPKGMSSAEVNRAPDRVTRPLYRAPRSDRFEPISWEAAFEGIARRIREVRDASYDATLRRTERICAFGSATVENEEVYLWVKLLRMLGIHHMQHQASI
ncbi:MAG: formate dehydrogenase subunit alpha [Deltaproteobacteria bacterium]|nr:MAG: formate dehydrogenase subunit alpha [Deltaproteobacteria bacterium]